MRKGRPYDPAWDAWRPARRWPGVLLSAFAVAVFVGAIAYHYSAHSGVKIPSYNPPAVDRVQPPYAFPVALNSSAAQTYQGKMTESNLTFVATGRLMVWDMRCKKCNANFGVLVHNSTGATVDIPANAIGESQSTVPAAYAKGTYHVTVIADAPWTVSLIDPTALATLAAPFNYFTYGTGVLGPFSGNDSSLLMGYIGTLGSAATVTVYDESLDRKSVV